MKYDQVALRRHQIRVNRILLADTRPIKYRLEFQLNTYDDAKNYPLTKTIRSSTVVKWTKLLITKACALRYIEQAG